MGTTRDKCDQIWGSSHQRISRNAMYEDGEDELTRSWDNHFEDHFKSNHLFRNYSMERFKGKSTGSHVFSTPNI
jgi:hypothetical protein